MFQELIQDFLIMIFGVAFFGFLAILPWVLLSLLLQAFGFHKASRFVDKVFQITVYAISAIITLFVISSRNAAPRQ